MGTYGSPSAVMKKEEGTSSSMLAGVYRLEGGGVGQGFGWPSRLETRGQDGIERPTDAVVEVVSASHHHPDGPSERSRLNTARC